MRYNTSDSPAAACAAVLCVEYQRADADVSRLHQSTCTTATLHQHSAHLNIASKQKKVK